MRCVPSGAADDWHCLNARHPRINSGLCARCYRRIDRPLRMANPSSVADSSASSRQGSGEQPLRVGHADARPASGLQTEAQVSQWEVVLQGDGVGLLVPASPNAPVPSIAAARADSTASQPGETGSHRVSRGNSDSLDNQRTWLSRVTDRTKLLREMFELESTEVCVCPAFLV